MATADHRTVPFSSFRMEFIEEKIRAFSAAWSISSVKRSRSWCLHRLAAANEFCLFQQPVFNSLTNCLGPRKLLHSGKLYKAKSSKELYGFLFNDFLLLTYMVKQFVSSGSDKLFSPKSNSQFKMYKMVSESRYSKCWYSGSWLLMRNAALHWD